MGQLWRKIERPEPVPVYLDTSDECYYAREYVSAGGFAAGTGNSLITNFKKTPDRKGKPEWRWKDQAIYQFACELNALLVEGCVAAIPSSKRRDDPNYDSRLDDTLATLAKQNPKVVVSTPFIVRESHQPVHNGGERGVDEFYEFLEWVGFDSPPEFVILIDDVITTGSHFKACQRMILEHHPGMKVYGVFWAKVVWPDSDIVINLG